MTSPNENRDSTKARLASGGAPLPNPEEVNEFHRYDDVDNSPESHHHTLGPDPNQSSPGDHNHDGRNSKLLASASHTHSGLVTPDSGWIQVGVTPGAPAFSNGWTTYNDGNFGGAFFRKLSSGLVLLTGLISSGTAGTAFTLPVGYRPNARVFALFGVHGSAGIVRVDVGNGGAVMPQVSTPPWISLAGIQFYADQ